MSNQPKVGAVIFAKNIRRVSEFYAGVLGFEIAHSEADHVVLESQAFQLVVHSIPEAIASSIKIESPPVTRTETPIKLVFFVPSLATSREVAAKLGGELNSPEREWRFQQSIVCDGHDPEGTVLQLRQNAG
jgi:predicted enzyme related to lactoylglutathione lyase